METKTTENEKLHAEFEDLLNSDPDFNYDAGEFDEWLKDCVFS